LFYLIFIKPSSYCYYLHPPVKELKYKSLGDLLKITQDESGLGLCQVRIYLEDDKNALKLIVVMVIQLCEYTEPHSLYALNE
jgi:hypothetical protein